ncbi:hypothetical protein EDC04DRAFT_2689017 [Pisolithus marmoratus]|nr:hypothetical protein EDC04DRAFT_2689017 [Pisolithus marmoratus]
MQAWRFPFARGSTFYFLHGFFQQHSPALRRLTTLNVTPCPFCSTVSPSTRLECVMYWLNQISLNACDCFRLCMTNRSWLLFLSPINDYVLRQRRVTDFSTDDDPVFLAFHAWSGEEYLYPATSSLDCHGLPPMNPLWHQCYNPGIQEQFTE